ncbi:helix-turn-helix transcriptional regulator [candidate division KSB1 bacterium]|nr:helix-turn-helix transcriptional regulator [candidate division KSB1 bacterium]
MGEFTIFGDFFKKLRIQKGYTLRKYCKEFNFDPGNISKLERGVLEPPSSRNLLEKHANCLGLKESSDEWYEFFDLAAACKGRIPQDMSSDEELIKKLPLVFRTLRGQKPNREDLKNLANIIKGSL